MSIVAGQRVSTGGTGREQILKAALREFAEKGYDGASTSSIARGAGVTQPLIHHHFGNKLSLWKAALTDIFEEFEVLQARTFEEVRGLEMRSVLRVLIRQFILFSARRPEMVRLMVIESARRGPNFQYLLEQHVRPLVRRFQKLLELGMDAGELRPLDRQLLHYFILGAAGYPSMVRAEAQELFGLDSTSTDFAHTYADLVVDVLYRGLTTDTGATDALQDSLSSIWDHGGNHA